MEQPVYPNYPEIFELIDFVKKVNIRTEVMGIQSEAFPYCEAVKFQIKGFAQVLYVDNEYSDFNINKPYLHAELCLQHLEEVEESKDFLEWTRWLGLKASSTEVLQYYRDLVSFNDKIRSLFSTQTIESFVLSFDFELNQKAAQALRNEDF